jgi:hypothetical protein
MTEKFRVLGLVDDVVLVTITLQPQPHAGCRHLGPRRARTLFPMCLGPAPSRELVGVLTYANI